MSVKILSWDEKKATYELNRRLASAKEYRSTFESQWVENEQTIYSTRGGEGNGTNINLDATFQDGTGEVDQSEEDSNISYAFKNFRFIHAQLSANPPSVVASPTSVDPEDRLKADAADRLIHHAIRKYKLQEVVDRGSLHCLLYGTGFVKIIWDSTRGDIIDFEEEKGEILLEGDISFSIPTPWDVYVDPDAESWDDVKWVFQRLVIPYEEAISRWPDKKEILEASKINGERNLNSTQGFNSGLSNKKYDSVELYEYWEKGLPHNGYLGRYSICTFDGKPVEKVRPNPHRFSALGAITKIQNSEKFSDEEKEGKIKKLPQKAKLPFHIFTDVDVPSSIWGKSFVDYVSHMQENLNRLDLMTLDTIAALGIPRAIVPDGAEIADDAFTNSPWNILKVAGDSNRIRVLNPPNVSPDVPAMRDRIKQGIDDIAGVNELMFGQINRETAGTAMQYATNQGNMIRRRLFNKYTLFVEEIYRTYLNLIRKHWDTERTINALGKEKLLQAVQIKGADIDGGYDLQVQYGTSFSLDPLTRRDEILTLQPLFEKANVPPRVQLQMLKLNELSGMHDLIQLAETRQGEVFEKIIANETYYPPEEFQDHENMIAYALRYFMTAEFDGLEDEVKELLRQHMRERIQLAAQEKAAVSGQPSGMPPGPPPAGPEAMGEMEQAPAGGAPMGPPIQT